MRRAIIFIPFFLFASCRRDDQIQTYRVSKEAPISMPMASGIAMGTPPTPPSESTDLPPGHPAVGRGTEGAPNGDMQAMGAGMEPAASPKEITWKVPSGWLEQAPTSIRVGSFLVKGTNGQTADISVIPLSGQAGGNLANINRWRGQINLGPISEADLSAQSENINPAGRKMLYINFVSHDPVIDNRYKKRLMAAIYQRGERTWFFKMLGEDATVLSAKPAFLKLLKSLQFHDQ